MIKWILNHLKTVVAVLAFTITIVIVGSVMLSSYISYKNYEKDYYQKDLNTRAAASAAPTSIDVNDDFVIYNEDGSVKKTLSTLKNNVTAWAKKLTSSDTSKKVVQGKTVVDSYLPALSSGGKVTVTFTLAQKAFVDIDFVVCSNYVEEDKVVTTKKLLSNVNFKVNTQPMDENIDLEVVDNHKQWHHIVMSNFALPKGKINIEISNMAGKEAYMPDIRNISVFSSAAVTLA